MVRVNQRKRCSALFEPWISTAPRRSYFDSQAGDSVGQGSAMDLRSSGRHVSELSETIATASASSIEALDFCSAWALDFVRGAVMHRLRLVRTGRQRALPLHAAERTVSIGGSGRGCSEITGRFCRPGDRLSAGRQRAAIRRGFRAALRRRCSGAVRGNPLQLDHQRPVVHSTATIRRTSSQSRRPTTVVSQAGASIAAPAVLSANVSLPAAAHLTTHGGTRIRLRVHRVDRRLSGRRDDVGARQWSEGVRGALRAARLRHRLARSAVLGQSAGRFHRLGRARCVYSPVEQSVDRDLIRERQADVSVAIDDAIDDWRLEFAAPQGQPLAVGYYSAARRYPFTPFNGLSVSGSGRGCNNVDRSVRRSGNRDRLGWDGPAIRGRLRTTLRRCRSRALRCHPLQLDDRRGRSVWRRVSVLSAFR